LLPLELNPAEVRLLDDDALLRELLPDASRYGRTVH
jgi:hypothetical protein